MARQNLFLGQLNIADLNAALNLVDGKTQNLTNSGTLPIASVDTGTQTANLVYASPDGASGAAAFRALTATDIPNLPASKITTGQLGVARGGTGADLSATGGANKFVKQTSAGGAFTVAAIGAGDVPDAALTSNVALLNRNPQTFTGANTFASSLIQSTTNGALMTFVTSESEVTLNTAGTTTTGPGLPGPGSLVLAVTTRVTQAISGGGVTKFSVGDGTTANRFATDVSTLTLNATNVGMNQWKGGVATDAAGPTPGGLNVVITTDATPTQGKVRVSIFAVTFTAATS